VGVRGHGWVPGRKVEVSQSRSDYAWKAGGIQGWVRGLRRGRGGFWVCLVGVMGNFRIPGTSCDWKGRFGLDWDGGCSAKSCEKGVKSCKKAVKSCEKSGVFEFRSSIFNNLLGSFSKNTFFRPSLRFKLPQRADRDGDFPLLKHVSEPLRGAIPKLRPGFFLILNFNAIYRLCCLRIIREVFEYPGKAPPANGSKTLAGSPELKSAGIIQGSFPANAADVASAAITKRYTHHTRPIGSCERIARSAPRERSPSQSSTI